MTCRRCRGIGFRYIGLGRVHWQKWRHVLFYQPCLFCETLRR
jgi:hypothetical protein